MQQKSFTLNGKRYRLDADVPAGEIRFIVNNKHALTDDADLRRDIEDRAKHWPERKRIQAVKFALYIHRKNQRLYYAVQRGM